MNDEREPPWMAQAQAGPAPVLDFAFCVVEEPRLYRPALPRTGGYVLSADVGDRVAELARYYLDVLQMLRNTRRTAAQHPYYFWVRPWILGGDYAISFPWYDTYEETLRFFRTVGEAAGGEAFWDRDQGWEIQMWAKEDRLYVHQWDPDAETEYVCVSFDRQALLGMIPVVQHRLDGILAELRRLVGGDYWSRHPGPL